MAPSVAALVANEGLPSVSPFVHVSFGGAAVKSTASAGIAPQWNELLTLPFTPPNNDFSPMALAAVRDDVVVSLFDEVCAHLRR